MVYLDCAGASGAIRIFSVSDDGAATDEVSLPAAFSNLDLSDAWYVMCGQRNNVFDIAHEVEFNFGQEAWWFLHLLEEYTGWGKEPVVLPEG